MTMPERSGTATKNRSLRRTFDRCTGSIDEATTLQADRVDS